MTYQALYRKWRPQSFAEIAGQDHITQTLQNALATGRISHAYLFCGTRGTGKTTTAKVLAKALNCLSEDQQRPCNRCENCLSITRGQSMDVIEIDAASNRGIDEIRDLRGKINFSPSGSKFRVYIIDEVHMMTNEAFNALLKTLEEPPSHVIFILATTEPHKIPLTVLSRCQRFDFRPIDMADMTARLREVAAGSDLKIDQEAVQVIARAAAGSLRDALGILDQAASFGAGEITAGEIHRILGTVDADVLEGMTAYILAGDTAGAIRLIDALVTGGKDLRVFARQLGSYWRGLLVAGISPGEKNEDRPRKTTLLFNVTKLLVRYEQDMRRTAQPRLLLELFVFESISAAGTGTAGDLALRLARLEERVEGLLKSGESRPPGPYPPVHAGEDAAIDLEKSLVKESLLEESLVEKIPVEKTPVEKTPVEEPPVEEPPVEEPPVEGSLAEEPSVRKTPVEKPPAGNNSHERDIPLDRVRQMWPQILETIKKESKAIFSYLKAAQLVGVAGFVLTLAYPSGDIAKDMMEKESNSKVLARVLEIFFKGDWTIRCEEGSYPPEEKAQEMDYSSAVQFFGAKEVDKPPLK